MHLADELPPITGMVLTSPKENELVEIPIVSPVPTGQVNPVLAPLELWAGPCRRFHLRRRPALGQGLARLEKLCCLLVASGARAMRPAERGNLTLAVRREEGRIKVVVDAASTRKISSSISSRSREM